MGPGRESRNTATHLRSKTGKKQILPGEVHTSKPKQTSTLTSHSVPKRGAGLNVRAKLTRI